MSNTVITDLLPFNSNIRGTPYEELINNTMGYFLELLEDGIDNIQDGFFIQSANGKYLDALGYDLNISRSENEDDLHYKNRLLIEPTDRFCEELLYDVYDIQLLTYNSDKNDCMLLSDNSLLANQYFVDVTDEIWNIIERKFITGNTLYKW